MGKRKQLAQSRKTAGYTQEGFAEALGVDRSTIVRWEAGGQEPLPYVRPKLARLLGVSPNELTELLCPSPSVDVGDAAPATRSDAVGSRLYTVVEFSGGNVKRRNVLLGGASLTAAVFAEPALLALTAPPVADVGRGEGSRRVGLADVEILAENVAHLRRMDFRYGSGRVRERAVALLHHETTRLVRGSYSDTTSLSFYTDAELTADLGRALRDSGESAPATRLLTRTFAQL